MMELFMCRNPLLSQVLFYIITQGTDTILKKMVVIPY